MMEVTFLSGEITVVRHLVDANPHMYIPLETKAPLKRYFAWKIISKSITYGDQTSHGLYITCMIWSRDHKIINTA